MYTNACSLRNKLQELKALTAFKRPRVICITETWFSEDEADGEITILGYNVVRKNRKEARGGGVAIYVASGL